MDTGIRFGRKLAARPTTLVAIFFGLSSAACLVSARPVASVEVEADVETDAYYVDEPYTEVYAAPSYVYEGSSYYWHNDLWWYRDGNRWAVLHSEPSELHTYRTGHWGATRSYGSASPSRPYKASPAYRAPARPRAAPARPKSAPPARGRGRERER
jgi:hypothetical protein